MLGSIKVKLRIHSQTPKIELLDDRNMEFICKVVLYPEEVFKKITV